MASEKPAYIGMTQAGSFNANIPCDGCGDERAVLTIECWQSYDIGPYYMELCAQCLRELAHDLDRYEINANKAAPND